MLEHLRSEYRIYPVSGVQHQVLPHPAHDGGEYDENAQRDADDRPKNELQAKFSMEFCMAILLLERKAGLAQFTDAVVRRSDVQRMIRQVEFGVHPEAEATGYEKMTTIVDIELKDGQVISGRADFGKGSPANPMSDDEVAAKFRECAVWGGLPAAAAERIIDMVFSLEKLSRTRDLTKQFAAGARRRRKTR